MYVYVYSIDILYIYREGEREYVYTHSVGYRRYGIWCMVYTVWYVKMGILRTMVSGIPLVSGLGTRIQDPCVFLYYTSP